MEAAIDILVTNFKTFAGKDGSSATLNRLQLQSLVISQLPNFVKNGEDPKVIEQLMNSFDEDNNGVLTFLDFWLLIGQLASKHASFS